VIDYPALRPQCAGDTAVTVLAVLQRRQLNGVAEPLLFFVGVGPGRAEAVVAGAAYGRQCAHPFNGQFALLPVHVPDLLVDGLPEVCPRRCCICERKLGRRTKVLAAYRAC
jgi:hypothetical protein